MSASKIRLFPGSSRPDAVIAGQPPRNAPEKASKLGVSDTVRVSVGDVIPLLLDAAICKRLWLEDFAEDAMDIPQDLYEVLLSYRTIAREAKRAA